MMKHGRVASVKGSVSARFQHQCHSSATRRPTRRRNSATDTSRPPSRERGLLGLVLADHERGDGSELPGALAGGKGGVTIRCSHRRCEWRRSCWHAARGCGGSHRDGPSADYNRHGAAGGAKYMALNARFDAKAASASRCTIGLEVVPASRASSAARWPNLRAYARARFSSRSTTRMYRSRTRAS